MIKKILLFSILATFSFHSFSQITYDNDSVFVDMVPGIIKNGKIKVTNSSNHGIQLSWRLLNSTLLDYGNSLGKWTLGFCDCVTCYSNDFAPLLVLDTCVDLMQPNESLDWKITVDPGSVQMKDAEWIIEVYNHTDNVYDTLSYFLQRPNSVKEVSYNANVTSYPNPANTEFVVNYKLTNVSAPTLNVYSIVGGKIGTYSLNQVNGSLNINTSSLENGMYFYTIEEQGQRVFIQKFNVVH